MGEIRDRIAANIKMYRKAAGLSVDDVGKAIGKSGKTISAWEVGRGQPDADETVLLCRVLDIELDDLYGNNSTPDNQLKELVELFEEIDENDREILLVLAQALAERSSKK